MLLPCSRFNLTGLTLARSDRVVYYTVKWRRKHPVCRFLAWAIFVACTWPMACGARGVELRSKYLLFLCLISGVRFWHARPSVPPSSLLSFQVCEVWWHGQEGRGCRQEQGAKDRATHAREDVVPMARQQPGLVRLRLRFWEWDFISRYWSCDWNWQFGIVKMGLRLRWIKTWDLKLRFEIDIWNLRTIYIEIEIEVDIEVEADSRAKVNFYLKMRSGFEIDVWDGDCGLIVIFASEIENINRI